MRALALLLLLPGCLLSGSEAGDDQPGPGPSGDGGGTFQCADDRAFEPNETTSSASFVATGSSLTGLATCPSGDRDTYQIQLNDSGAELFVQVVWEQTTAPLTIVLLDIEGIVITGTRPQDATSATSCASGLAPGTYFAQVTGPQNNYRLDVDVFLGGTCP